MSDVHTTENLRIYFCSGVVSGWASIPAVKSSLSPADVTVLTVFLHGTVLGVRLRFQSENEVLTACALARTASTRHRRCQDNIDYGVSLLTLEHFWYTVQHTSKMYKALNAFESLAFAMALPVLAVTFCRLAQVLSQPQDFRFDCSPDNKLTASLEQG